MLKFAVAPTAIDCGMVSPVSLNPVPVIVACEMVSVVFPVFFNCTVCVLLELVETDPKLTLAGVTLNPACTPVPLAVTFSVWPCVVIRATVPFTAPIAVGANFTLSVMLCEAAIVVGVVTPVAEYPVPLTVICERFAVEFPVFVMVTFCAAVVPMLTLPKLKLAGVAVSVELAATPVPERATVAGELGALLTIERLPLKLPAVSGANCAVKVLLCPAAIANGVVNPLTLKPVPLGVT
jgi:hypothetical protein